MNTLIMFLIVYADIMETFLLISVLILMFCMFAEADTYNEKKKNGEDCVQKQFNIYAILFLISVGLKVLCPSSKEMAMIFYGDDILNGKDIKNKEIQTMIEKQFKEWE